MTARRHQPTGAPLPRRRPLTDDEQRTVHDWNRRLKREGLGVNRNGTDPVARKRARVANRNLQRGKRQRGTRGV